MSNITIKSFVQYPFHHSRMVFQMLEEDQSKLKRIELLVKFKIERNQN
jgi:hypothetical protein